MVLILSSTGDLSTELVMNWLRHYNHPFVRINSHDLLDEKAFISFFPAKIKIGDIEINPDEVHAIWFRKFAFFRKSKFFKDNEQDIIPNTIYQLQREFSSLTSGFTSIFQDKYWLTHPQSASVNKLRVLKFARQCGLQVPDTYVLNNRAQLQELLKETSLISKSAYEPFFLSVDEGMYSMYTKEVTPEIAAGFDETFYPSLLQSKVEKEYELRIFYLDGEFYPMAIFSQQDKQTEVDFRMYNWDTPNRNIPYVLPEDLKNKLHQLMQKLNLNTGSMDVIRGKDGGYYFLEVNPTGQFGMTSIPCNYSLHELVAKHLIEKDKEYAEVY